VPRRSVLGCLVSLRCWRSFAPVPLFDLVVPLYVVVVTLYVAICWLPAFAVDLFRCLFVVVAVYRYVGCVRCVAVVRVCCRTLRCSVAVWCLVTFAVYRCWLRCSSLRYRYGLPRSVRWLVWLRYRCGAVTLRLRSFVYTLHVTFTVCCLLLPLRLRTLDCLFVWLRSCYLLLLLCDVTWLFVLLLLLFVVRCYPLFVVDYELRWLFLRGVVVTLVTPVVAVVVVVLPCYVVRLCCRCHWFVVDLPFTLLPRCNFYVCCSVTFCCCLLLPYARCCTVQVTLPVDCDLLTRCCTHVTFVGIPFTVVCSIPVTLRCYVGSVVVVNVYVGYAVCSGYVWTLRLRCTFCYAQTPIVTFPTARVYVYVRCCLLHFVTDVVIFLFVSICTCFLTLMVIRCLLRLLFCCYLRWFVRYRYTVALPRVERYVRVYGLLRLLVRRLLPALRLLPVCCVPLFALFVDCCCYVVLHFTFVDDCVVAFPVTLRSVVCSAIVLRCCHVVHALRFVGVIVTPVTVAACITRYDVTLWLLFLRSHVVTVCWILALLLLLLICCLRCCWVLLLLFVVVTLLCPFTLSALFTCCLMLPTLFVTYVHLNVGVLRCCVAFFVVVPLPAVCCYCCCCWFDCRCYLTLFCLRHLLVFLACGDVCVYSDWCYGCCVVVIDRYCWNFVRYVVVAVVPAFDCRLYFHFRCSTIYVPAVVTTFCFHLVAGAHLIAFDSLRTWRLHLLHLFLVTRARWCRMLRRCICYGDHCTLCRVPFTLHAVVASVLLFRCFRLFVFAFPFVVCCLFVERVRLSFTDVVTFPCLPIVAVTF